MSRYNDEIEEYLQMARSVENDTTFERWGMLTQDRRYNGQTEEVVNIIKNEHNLTNDQAHYFVYFMLKTGMSYEETKTELLSSKDFEEYDAQKKARRNIL